MMTKTFLLISALFASNAIADVQNELLHPYKYIGWKSKEVAKVLNTTVKPNGNVIHATETHEFLFESSDGKTISYVTVDFLDTMGCSLDKEFDSRILLAELGISARKFEVASKRTSSQSYYDHENRLKVSSTCVGEGQYIYVGFSKKYYGY